MPSALIKCPIHQPARAVAIKRRAAVVALWLFFAPVGAYAHAVKSNELRSYDEFLDPTWLREAGVIPANDQLSVKEFLQVENQSEEKLGKVREPALKVALALLR
jgi:hypothetical protein